MLQKNSNTEPHQLCLQEEHTPNANLNKFVGANVCEETRVCPMGKNESLNDNNILLYDRTNMFYHISAKKIMICSTWNFYLTMCICALEVKTQFKTESELHSKTSVLQRALHHHHLHLYGI